MQHFCTASNSENISGQRQGRPQHSGSPRRNLFRMPPLRHINECEMDRVLVSCWLILNSLIIKMASLYKSETVQKVLFLGFVSFIMSIFVHMSVFCFLFIIFLLPLSTLCTRWHHAHPPHANLFPPLDAAAGSSKC